MNMVEAHDPYAALADVEAQLRELPAGPSRERFELDTLADRLRAALAEENADALAAATAEWSERAANKGSHEDRSDLAIAMIATLADDSGTA